MAADKKQEALPTAVRFQQEGHQSVQNILNTDPEKDRSKLAVLFPGTGYSCDRPLLHFARRMAEQNGCDVLPANYTVSLGHDLNHLEENVRRCLPLALQAVEAALGEVLCRHSYRDIFFFSKSFGTIVAGELERQLQRRVHQFFLTPLEPTFPYLKAHPCYVSCGTADPWVPDTVRRQFVALPGIRLGLFPSANHSLEIPDDAEASVCNLQMVVSSYADFLREKP